MTKQSLAPRYRKRAADELRAARQTDDLIGREERINMARAFKLLAANEEWLSGNLGRERRITSRLLERGFTRH